MNYNEIRVAYTNAKTTDDKVALLKRLRDKYNSDFKYGQTITNSLKTLNMKPSTHRANTAMKAIIDLFEGFDSERLKFTNTVKDQKISLLATYLTIDLNVGEKKKRELPNFKTLETKKEKYALFEKATLPGMFLVLAVYENIKTSILD